MTEPTRRDRVLGFAQRAMLGYQEELAGISPEMRAMGVEIVAKFCVMQALTLENEVDRQLAAEKPVDIFAERIAKVLAYMVLDDWHAEAELVKFLEGQDPYPVLQEMVNRRLLTNRETQNVSERRAYNIISKPYPREWARIIP